MKPETEIQLKRLNALFKAWESIEKKWVLEHEHRTILFIWLKQLSSELWKEDINTDEFLEKHLCGVDFEKIVRPIVDAYLNGFWEENKSQSTNEVGIVTDADVCEVYTDCNGVHHYEFPEIIAGDLGYSEEDLRIVRLVWHAHPEWQDQGENSSPDPDWDAIDKEFIEYREATQ